MKTFPILILIVSFCLVPDAQARTWTSIAGRTIEADFVKADESNVTLKRDDGKIFTLAVNKLSEADNQFIAEETGKGSVEKKSDAASITGKIREPKDGEKVESGFLFKALTRGAPKGYVALIFTREVKDDGYMHPRGRILEVNRSITSNVHHGSGDSGKWSMHLYVLPEEDADGLMNWLIKAEQQSAIGNLKQIKAWDKALMEKAVEVASLKYTLKPK